MRVGTKLTIVTVTGVLLVLGLHGYLRIGREIDLLTQDMERDHRTLARGLRLAAQVVADRSGLDAAIDLLQEANQRESKMTITWSAGEPAPPAPSKVHVERITQGEEQWLITRVAMPLRGTPGVLQLRESMAQPLSYVHSTVMRTAVIMTQVAILCVIVIVSASLLFVGRPLRLLVAKVRRVGEGHLRDPVLIQQRDEIGELAREVDAMCQQLDGARARLEVETQQRVAAVDQMRHADRLRMVGHLASGVAHELGTPLNVILAHARSIARHGVPDAPERSDAAVIVEQSERMSAIIRQMLDLARPRARHRQREDIRSVVCATLSVIEPMAAKHGVAISGPADTERVDAEVDAGQIGQVVGNLVINAIQAQPAGGAVRVSVGRSHGDVCIRVEDDGPGIAAEAIDRVFEPFFTTKEPGDGTGLGLAVSDGIVRDHGGRIEVESPRAGGTAFTGDMPVPPAA